MLFILKVVAWLERPHARAKDLDDLVYLLEHVLEEDDDRRWDAEHPVGSSGLSFDAQSAFFMGQEVGALCEPAHRTHVARFLDLVRDPDSASFARMLRVSRALEHDDEYLKRLLGAFERGVG